MNSLTQEKARALFDYIDGVLMWRTRPREDFATLRACSIWNAKYPGTVAGHVLRTGYRHVSIGGKSVKTARLIWLRERGHWPEYIDHIDGNRLHERMENLRDVTKTENNKNRAMKVDSRCPAQGVYRSGSKWRASIGNRSRQVYLGTFATVEEAITARKAAEREFGFHPNHGRPALARKIAERKAALKAA